MSEHDRNDEDGARRLRVTDKRRVRPDDEAPPQAPPEAGAPSTGPSADADGPEELERVRAQAAEYLEHLQRLKAEFDNYRKRVVREQTQAVELAATPLVAKLLEVLDEFELALASAERHGTEDRFTHGVQLVYAKLKDILRSEGLERIGAEGKRFDPELHEALLEGEGGTGDPYVDDVLRTGYTLKGRVLRPAGVKVVRR